MLLNTQRWLPLTLLPFLLLPVLAHEHHDTISDEDLNKPIDSILYMHMGLQALVWGVIFPVGMVFGIVRHRLHVPLQILGFVLTIGGYILGHSHGGRAFPASIHGRTASLLYFPIALQFGLGVYLKLHIHEGTYFRKAAVKAHGIVGASYPILGWVQMLFGALTLGGYCHGGHLGQCLAHYIMGSSFIGYGVLMTLILVVGRGWVPGSSYSPEWWDSWVITLWGIVNTFTEHRGAHWSHKDMQHTSLGVLWWAGGILGIWTSRKRQRSVVPAIIVMITGWAMSAHTQATETSTKIHTTFGVTLMSAGLVRLIEVGFGFVFPPSEGEDTLDRTSTIRPFQHLPPFLLVAAGLLFMSATDEELEFIDKVGMDHVTYTLIMFSWAFFIYFYVNVLVYLYTNTGRNAGSEKPSEGYYKLLANGSRHASDEAGRDSLHDGTIFEMSTVVDDDAEEIK
ncbi:hypothetical protein SISNIDRAFT_488744 [Sistotremastrum niveocremeum HHB9708]|uniref:Protein YTP1-like C-terminal domain-containing protein n=1 Tax=Sistotremastrum niveocremeum HHB9708 TaxID=1314777 RepID=A0A164QQI1_9AGAM|nr:hypothetical protein SISNIDRAFT_488744 [Sistotremastrum niveocremeum HHB9708]